MFKRTLLALALVLAILHPGSAGAQEEPHGGPTATIPPGSITIGDGLAFTAAVVTTDGEPAEEWDGHQTATFMQAWIGDTIFGTPVPQDPPADLPVYRIDVTGSWGYTPLGTRTLYYASDGETAWLSSPANQAPRTTGDTTPPPPPSNWFIATPRTVGAFNGTEELIVTPGVGEATSTTAAPGAESAATDDDAGASSEWFLPAILAAALIGGVVLWVLRRRGRHDGSLKPQA